MQVDMDEDSSSLVDPEHGAERENVEFPESERQQILDAYNRKAKGRLIAMKTHTRLQRADALIPAF